MSVHTPGPWEVRIERGKHCIRPADVKQAGHTVGYAPLAKVEGDRRVGSQAENARLIAAAPELLEALQGYVRVIAQAGGGDKQLFMAAIRAADQAARAAIAKATGEQA